MKFAIRALLALLITCGCVAAQTAVDDPITPLSALPGQINARVVALTLAALAGKMPNNPSTAQTPTGYWNMSGASLRLPESVFASLPAASGVTGKVYIVTDCATAACAAGSGTTRAIVRSNGTTYDTLGGGVSSGGDFSSNTSTSVDSELVVFSGTAGKTGKRATMTGIPKLTSGVLSAAAAADIIALWDSGSCSGFLQSDGTCAASGGLADPGSNGIIKRTALNTTTPATIGTDYQAAISGGPCTTGQHVQNINASTGAITCSADATSSSTSGFAGEVSVTIAANQNDLTTTGCSSADTIYVNGGAADRTITGLACSPGADRVMRIVNSGATKALLLTNQSGSSSAVNRFLLPADLSLPPNASITFLYDSVTSRWRPLSRENALILPVNGGSTGQTLQTDGATTPTLTWVDKPIQFNWRVESATALTTGQLTATDIWVNGLGATATVQAVTCRTDTGTLSVVITKTSGATVGTFSCTSTVSTSTTIGSPTLVDNEGLNIAATGGTSTRLFVSVRYIR